MSEERRTYWILMLIVLAVALISTAATLFFCRPQKAELQPQTEQLQAIEAQLGRVEGMAKEIHDQQMYEAYMRDWRNQK